MRRVYELVSIPSPCVFIEIELTSCNENSSFAEAVHHADVGPERNDQWVPL